MHSPTKTMILAATLLGSAAAAAAEPPPVPESDKSDYMLVYASHAEPKPTDPVVVRFSGIKVSWVRFMKPVKQGLEGASAQFQVDLTSLKSGSDKRDKDLKSDYLDADKYATITVNVASPRQTEGGNYRAPAKVAFRGKTYDWDILFKVVETLPNGVRIRGEHKLTRKELGVGKESGDSVGQDLLVRLQLTLTSDAKAKSTPK